MPVLLVAQLTLIAWRCREISQAQCHVCIIQQTAIIQLLIRVGLPGDKRKLVSFTGGNPNLTQFKTNSNWFKSTLTKNKLCIEDWSGFSCVRMVQSQLLTVKVKRVKSCHGFSFEILVSLLKNMKF